MPREGGGPLPLAMVLLSQSRLNPHNGCAVIDDCVAQLHAAVPTARQRSALPLVLALAFDEPRGDLLYCSGVGGSVVWERRGLSDSGLWSAKIETGLPSFGTSAAWITSSTSSLGCECERQSPSWPGPQERAQRCKP